MTQTNRPSLRLKFIADHSLLLVVIAPFVYLVFCAFVGALAAYPLHFLFAESVDFQALVYKTAELLMAFGLYPLGRWLGMGRVDIALAGPVKLLLRQILRGFGWGALMLGLHVLVLVLLDVRVLNPEKLQIARIVSLSCKGVLIGLAIAALEEPIFRGFLFGILLRKTNRVNAVLVASFYFAALHFLSTDMRPELADVRWNTGVMIVLDAFSNLFRIHVDSFIALFAAGAFLSMVRLYFSNSGLSYCIGIHAGWVFVIKATNPLTIRSIVSPLQNIVSSFDGNIGYLSASWTAVLIALLVMKMNESEVSRDTPHRVCRLGNQSLTILGLVSVLALTVIRLLLAGKTELVPEEAYYWTYSQHPALSYFDHPPMVAWMVALGTSIVGNTELGVRIVTILLWPVSALLVFSTARLWFEVRAAELAVLFFCLCPVFVGIGFIVTPDSPLVFFWLLTLYAVSMAITSGRSDFWILAGIGFGCALLSKYTAVMLAGSLFLFLLLSAKYRFWLLRFSPWFALLLGIALFTPVIIWNSQHQWASFVFQSTRTEVGNNDPVRVESGTFWLYQLWALTPFLFGLFVYTLKSALQRGWVQREDPWNFSMSFAMPLFLVFVLASFKTKGHINWTAPAYLSWSMAAAAVFLQAPWRPLGPSLTRWVIGAAVFLCITANALVHTSLAWGVPQSFALKSAGGWRGLAGKVREAQVELDRNTGNRAFILGADKYNIAAELGFYSPEPADIVNDYSLGNGGLGYRFWIDLKSLEGRPAIAIFEQDKIGPYSDIWLKQHFKRVDEWLPVEIEGNGSQKRRVYLVKCYDYMIGNNSVFILK